ncbi:unnamed protein product [Peronospora effusa]|nr:unnamed protein product [Peronospora effusa]
MASLGPNDVTMASDMEEQYQEQQEGDRETMQTAEENVSVESTTTTVEEITTFEETPTITTVEEHQISEVFVSTDSISAVAMEEIAETIAARDSVNLDMDYSVAATLGSSMDGESVRTEDFAEEEVFIEEECSKNAEVDFTELAELAAADEAIEAAKTQYSSDKGTETTEDLKQVCATRKIQDSKEISAETEVEMGISVGPALGSLVDVDNVLSLGDMCNTSNVDGMETTDALTRNETLKSTEVVNNLERDSTLHRDVSADAASPNLVAQETSVVVTTESESTDAVDPVIEEAAEEVVTTDTKAATEGIQCVTAVAIDRTTDSCEAETSEVILTDLSSEPSNGFHARADSPESASRIPETATTESESTDAVDPVIEEAAEEVVTTDTKAAAEGIQCVTAVAIDRTTDSCEAETSEAILTDLSSEPSNGFHAPADSPESASRIPETATTESESTDAVDPVIEEAAEEVVTTDTKAAAEGIQCVTAVAIDRTTDSCEAETSEAILTDLSSEPSNGFHAPADSPESASRIPETATTESESTDAVDPVIEEAAEEVVTTDTKAAAEGIQCVTAVAIDRTTDSYEAETSEAILTDLSSEPSNGFHAPADSPESASRIPNTAAVEHDHEANISEKVPPKRFSSMLTRFAEKITLKTGPHRTDSAAKLELNSPAPVENIVHHLEEHETVSPQTHRTPSAAKLDLSGSSPVKNVVDRFEAHQNEDNALDSLKIRTKRDFFSEKGRSISVSHEKEKYNTQTAQRAKKEAEAKEQLKSPAKKHSPVYRKSSAMSSVRNMASRFEKKADQSLDNLSFRTVRSFFPTEKSIHVGAEKMKYEALEKENQSAKEAEENFVKHGYHEQRTSSDVATILTDKKEPAAEKFVEEDAVAQITPSMDDMPSTPTKPNETATLKADRTPEPYPRRHTVSTKSDSPNVRGIAYRFETKRANSVVSTPVRTIDTFIVPKSEASVCVSAETAKFETPEKQVRSGKRTIDDFLVPESEASVRVSAEKEKFEKPVKQVKATVRTIDTFIVPDNEASVRVSAEKAKFETPEKLVKAPVRTIDTFIVPDSESSVCVSAEKAKFESPEQQMRLTGPVVRTIDTFIVPESEVSVHVAAEKAKLEALEKQKQCELEAQAAIKKQKSERSMLLASEKAKLEEASQMSEEVKTVEDVAMAHEAEEVEVVGETEVAETTKVTTEAEAVKEIEAIKEPVVVETEAAKVAEVALETKLVPETTVAMQIVAAKTEEIRERDVTADSTTTEEAEVGWEFGVGKNEETDVVEATAVAEQTEVAAGTKKANESEEVDESEGATKRTDEVEEKTAMEVMEMTMVTDVKESEVITSIKEANVTKEVVEIVQENKKAEVDEVFEEIEEVTETEEVSDCGVVKTIEEVLNETTNEEHEVQNWANFSIPAVEVTVERQTFGDIVSTTQHVHWLSLPMSVNPALARLHTVLRDHNPLTAYALYPSNPPSPTSRNK